jgi:hypothetical protein
VMNADGSPGIHADVSAGAKIPYLSAVGWSFGGAGLVLGLVAAGFVVLAVRPVRGRPAGGTTGPRRSGATLSGGSTA